MRRRMDSDEHAEGPGGHPTRWRDALAQLQAGLRLSLIILDLAMPVMNGVEFRRHQQADHTLACIPVIVLSGGDEARRRMTGRSCFAETVGLGSRRGSQV